MLWIELPTALKLTERRSIKTLRTLLVPPTFVQANGEDFGTLVEEKLAATGDEWKGVSFADAQDSLHNADKAKAELEKRSLNCNHKVFNSQSISTMS